MPRKRKYVIAAAVLAVLATATAAVALWNALARGSGEATATTAVEAVVSPVGGDADLYPGFTGGDVSFTIANDNPYDVVFTDMTATTITSSDAAGCPASNITVDAASGLALAAAGGSTTGTLSIPDVVTMASSAPDGCQGVSFSIALELTGVQAAG